MTPLRVFVCAGLALPLVSTAVLAGDLNPPPGPVAPTMKSLAEISPGRSVADLPGDEVSSHVISSPGVYVFSRDLVGEAGKDGIFVDCDAFAPGEHTVTISLRGFSMRGVPGSANAINVRNSDPVNRRVHVVIDGSLAGGLDGAAPTSLITEWGIDGVHVEGASSCVVSCVRAVGCGDDGYDSSGGLHHSSVNLVTSSFESNGSNGIRVSLPAGGPSSLEIQEISSIDNGECGARILYAGGGNVEPSTGASRIRIRGASMHQNAQDGMYISGGGEESISYDFEELYASNNGANGARLSMDRTRSRSASRSFLRCSFDNNFGDGIVCTVADTVPDLPGSFVFESCGASGNMGAGFRFDSSASAPGGRHSIAMDACDASENMMSGFIIYGSEGARVRSSMRRCRASDNGGHGAEMQALGSSMDLCVFEDNVLSGVSFNGCPAASPVRCRMSGNGQSGLFATGFQTLSIADTSFVDNVGDGVQAHGGGGSAGAVFVFRRGMSSGNGGSGVLVVDVQGDGVVEGVTSSGNGGAGIAFASPVGLGCGTATIERCVTNNNSGSGIDLNCTAGGLVRRCESSGNGAFGFVVSGNGHTVIENTASRNPMGGYQVPVQGNSVGPITDQSGIATNTNPSANYVR